MHRLTSLLAGLVLTVASAAAVAQSYPSRPVRLVVGFAPGGAADTVARAMSDAMGRALGQTIVVDNKPGAGSSLAAEHVAKSAARRLHAADRQPEQHLGQSGAQSAAALQVQRPAAGAQGDELAADHRGQSGHRHHSR